MLTLRIVFVCWAFLFSEGCFVESLCSNNGFDEGTETDVDCGGRCIKKCVTGKKCQSAGDCINNLCKSSVCSEPATCLDLHKQNESNGNGIYNIKTKKGELAVYCNMEIEDGGWTMVYKLSAGTSNLGDYQYASNFWIKSVVEENRNHLNMEKNGNYKNLIVNDWKNAIDISDILVISINNSSLAWFLFSSSGSDRFSWFSRDYLSKSSYNNVFNGNIFNIEGDNRRQWFINKNYGGCQIDAGWILVNTMRPDVTNQFCPWEKGANEAADTIKIFFSKLDGPATWQKNNGLNTNDVAVADVFAVFVR